MAGSHSRREFLTLAGAAAASAGFEPDRAGPGGPGAVAHRFSDAIQAKAPRRFIIDSHQHYDGKPDYFQRLVATYRPRNAMACVLADVRLRCDETRGRRPRRRRDPIRPDQRRRSRRGGRHRQVRGRWLQGHQDAQPAQELGRCLGIFRSTRASGSETSGAVPHGHRVSHRGAAIRVDGADAPCVSTRSLVRFRI